MAVIIPTTQQIFDDNLANYQSELNQIVPPMDVAFLRVQSGVEAGNFTILYKYGFDAAKQALAISATAEGLTQLGQEYGIPRNPAVAAQLTVDLPGVDPTLIPISTQFVGNDNGVVYQSLSAIVTDGGVAVIPVIALTVGVQGNLNIGQTMGIVSPVAGATTTATISSVDVVGAEEEDLELWRNRILSRIQTPPQGGATTDYRAWSKEVSGVKEAYPYALPQPGDIQVYIEVTSDIDPDGIPPQAILDDVEYSIIYDENGLQTRMPLNVDLLSVLPIYRTQFYLQISGLVVDNEAVVKENISIAVDEYFRNKKPYIQGLDLISKKNDIITDTDAGCIVNGVVTAAGGSVESVAFGLSSTTFLPKYILGVGELAKLATGGVSYV